MEVGAGQVRNKPIYVVIGVTANGNCDILGLRPGDGGEGVKFWLQVLIELKNRGLAERASPSAATSPLPSSLTGTRR
jgi:putative transposase